jgi:hypothetical protein
MEKVRNLQYQSGLSTKTGHALALVEKEVSVVKRYCAFIVSVVAIFIVFTANKNTKPECSPVNCSSEFY